MYECTRCEHSIEPLTFLKNLYIWVRNVTEMNYFMPSVDRKYQKIKPTLKDPVHYPEWLVVILDYHLILSSI